MKKLLLLFVAFAMILSCSKDDDATGTAPTTITGGEAFKGEIVTIEMPEGSLEADEYPATFNGLEVVALKASPTKLVFSIPSSTPVGLQSLVVASLSLTVSYDVKDVVLPGTPEEVVEGFKADFSTFLQMMEGSPEVSDAQGAIDSFNAWYENATDEEKSQVAATYFANKDLLDEILLSDYPNVAGRNITSDDLLQITKHSYAVIAMVAGSAIVIYGPGPDKILGAVVAVAGAVKAKNYFFNLATKLLSTDGIELDGQAGINDRNVNALPVFYHDAAKTLSFKTKERKLTAADAGRTQPSAVSLFSMYSKYNWCAGKINTALTWVNNNVPFVSFNLVPLEQFSATAPLSGKNITADTFSNLTFSVNHPNVTLENVSFVAEGQISLKFSITGTPSPLPVETMLSYSYADEISSFTGKFPIQVTNQLICETVTDFDGNIYNVVPIGTQCWTAHNLNVSHYRNGDPIPQIQNDQDWLNATGGAWCYYANNTENGIVFGKLYNWYAVNDPRGLAPEGYHIPSRDEWNQMKDFLGGATVAGGKLKTVEHWQAPNAGATNETGFSAVPGSQRNGSFYTEGFGIVGVYWTSTENADDEDGEDAWSNTLTRTSTNVSEYQGSWKKVGMSVRCVKD